MNKIVEIASALEQGLDLPCEWPRLTPLDWDRTRPEAHWLLLDRHGKALARASGWCSRVPALAGEWLGSIGHFAAVDSDCGARVLAHAAKRLVQAGASLVIGPIDGSTWESYRCVVESDGSPPFVLEPVHPAHWLAAFAQAGFRPWAYYRSALCDDMARAMRRFDSLAAWAGARSRVRLRAIEPARWPEELRGLHRLATQAFARSRLISAIDEDRFVQRFGALSDLVARDLVWVAEVGGEPAGFVIALQGSGPVWGDSLIVKTLCALRCGPSQAIALLLMRRVFESALSRGLRRAVFALMDESNLSSRMVAEHVDSRSFRRYALLAYRPLCQGGVE